MIAATTTNDPAVWVLFGSCLVLAALAAAAIVYPAAKRAVQHQDDREHDEYLDWLDSLEES